MAQVFLRKNEERRIKNGHLWVFSNEFGKITGNAENGDIVELFESNGNPLGSGFYNKNSLIGVRLFHPSFNGDFGEYASERIAGAYSLRKALYPNRNSFRLVFSESDYLPGLIIDKFNDSYVLQVYSAGMEKNIDAIVNVLKNLMNAQTIFTHNESYFRKLEGLSDEDKVYFGGIKEEIIDDGKLKYRINFNETQKTGFFFDQCDNREFIEKLVKDKSVLDAFCNSGGFGMHAAHAGAGQVTFVDASDAEINNVKINYELNNLTAEKEFIKADVFDFLEKSISENKKFDVVMLDPPAFAKSRKSLPSAIKGYIKLNRLALEIVNENGFLVTSSCSYHLKENDFTEAVSLAAAKSGRKIQQIYFNGASLDHPRIPAMEETSYLKFAIFKIS
ncbi:MAG: class I SAM-dependent rRNA methyltransferase [Ignavibacteriae bacterium]|nr:MAG: class I SAM-dependent rRNA methyltransferase [Ignavibacteriota bacterium]